jgi:ribosomal protein S18 acetylase RimI-like enzyme
MTANPAVRFSDRRFCLAKIRHVAGTPATPLYGKGLFSSRTGMNGMSISEIKSAADKSELCKEIMSGLPEWFEAAEEIAACAEAVKAMPVFAANGEVTGFIALKDHPPVAMEIFAIATRKEFHGKGNGRRLIRAAEDHALRNLPAAHGENACHP